MKYMKLFLLFAAVISVVFLSGCGVPKDKYETVLKEKAALEEKVTVLTAAKDVLKKEYENLLKDKMDLAVKAETLANEKLALKGEYDKILDEKISLKAAYDKLSAGSGNSAGLAQDKVKKP
ncbi:MAG: hypothetical protein Q7S07_05590 [Candidatus Omnitrophota bacterium]|nr:hypothetical protein [Candidatus Omnitrophota bacterium]